MKTGFIAILGKPNVGKSSLINAMVGEKVSIVSPKAQTTRDRALGILSTDCYQMVFVDTPGVHRAVNKLGEYMEKCVKSATVDADAIVIVLDGTRYVTDGDISFVEKYLTTTKSPVFVVLNKIDVAKYDKIYPLIDKLSYLTKAVEGRRAIVDIIPTSAKKNKNIDVLLKALENVLVDGEPFFPIDEYTDKNERYIISEIIREKALLLLSDEIPHGIAVDVRQMYTQENGAIHICCDIVVEKATHKPIVIGNGGEMLKAIGERSRKDIEKLLDTRVYLELFVKVREGWRNDSSVLNEIGFNPKQLN